jgi:hypothetical protein
MLKRGFASDNNAGVHPEILKAIEKANQGHTIAYGDDVFTERGSFMNFLVMKLMSTLYSSVQQPMCWVLTL